MPKCFDTPKAFGHPSCHPALLSCPAAAAEGPEPFMGGDFTLSAPHPAKQRCRPSLLLLAPVASVPLGTAVARGWDACCMDAQRSPGTRAAGPRPSCLLPLGDSVVLSKELVIHLLGGRILPQRFGGKEGNQEGKWAAGQAGKEPRRTTARTEAAAGAAAARLRCISRFPRGKRKERNQFKGWCQCQEAHSFSKGHKDGVYLFKPLAQEHCT